MDTKQALEDMKSPEPKIKTDAIKQLNQIAVQIGKDRSRSELVPYVIGNKNIITKECIDDEEDEEFLVELCKSLPAFLDNIGGQTHALKIIKIFEHIIIQDDTNVRREVSPT